MSLFFRISAKSLRIFFRTVEVFLALIIVMGGLAFWRLSVAPVNVDFLVPKLIDKFVPKDAGITVDIRSVILRAEVEDDGILHLEIKDLSVLGRDGTVITDLPEIEMSYGLWRILTLNYMPDTLTVKKALLQAVLDENGNFYLQNKKNVPQLIEQMSAEQTLPQNTENQMLPENETTESKPILVSDANWFINYILSFRRLELEDAQIVVDDRKNDKQYAMPQLDILLEKMSLHEYSLQAHADVISGKDKLVLEVKALFNRATRLLSFETDFKGVNLTKLSPVIPVLAEAKLLIKGIIVGELDLSKKNDDIRKSVRALSFKLENEKPGTVNLPAPLTNQYTVSSMLIQGAFAPGLESLKIDQSKLTTGQTTASLTVDIAGIGTFLDTKDLSHIKTVLKSTVKNVKTEEVPGLWPSALGPDAHAWVKANLSKGSISTADFTLYFTGDNLDDLFGDIKASGISVRYLDPMPPVNNVVARVYLHPDSVDIFANAGQLGDIQLTKAELYLTELQEDVSNAKILLSGKGPVQQVMQLINYKPLEFAKEFGIDPAQTGGTGTVNVALQFPLIETLNVNQVNVKVDADIVNGVFPTPAKNVSIDNGTFKLAVNNTQLTLDGNAQLKGLPLAIKWDEYFVQSKQNKTKSRYYLTGTITDSVVSKWVPDASGYFTGKIPAVVDIKESFNKTTEIKANLDLTPALVHLHAISLDKALNTPGSLEVGANFSSNKSPTAFSFNLNVPKQPLIIKGSVDLSNGLALNLDQVLGPQNSFSGKLIVDKRKNTQVVLKGKSWNMTKLFDMPYFKRESKVEEKKVAAAPQTVPFDIRMDVALDQLTLEDKKPLHNVIMKGVRRSYNWQSLDISARGSSDFSLFIVPQTKQLKGESQNVGDLLSRLGVTSRFFGGRLNIDAKLNKNGNFVGDITVRNFNLKDPGFIIQAVTILGIVDGIRGKELHFKRAYIPFELTPFFALEIGEGYANGTTLGVTFRGSAKFSELNMYGSVIPAYAINSLPGRIPVIGGLFKDGAGGGLMGVRYELKGSAFKPAVTFNPLTSIAPGILGTLFN